MWTLYDCNLIYGDRRGDTIHVKYPSYEDVIWCKKETREFTSGSKDPLLHDRYFFFYLDDKYQFKWLLPEILEGRTRFLQRLHGEYYCQYEEEPKLTLIRNERDMQQAVLKMLHYQMLSIHLYTIGWVCYECKQPVSHDVVQCATVGCGHVAHETCISDKSWICSTCQQFFAHVRYTSLSEMHTWSVKKTSIYVDPYGFDLPQELITLFQENLKLPERILKAVRFFLNEISQCGEVGIRLQTYHQRDVFVIHTPLIEQHRLKDYLFEILSTFVNDTYIDKTDLYIPALQHLTTEPFQDVLYQVWKRVSSKTTFSSPFLIHVWEYPKERLQVTSFLHGRVLYRMGGLRLVEYCKDVRGWVMDRDGKSPIPLDFHGNALMEMAYKRIKEKTYKRITPLYPQVPDESTNAQSTFSYAEVMGAFLDNLFSS